MNRQVFTWDRFSKKLRQKELGIESLLLVGLFLAALGLYCTNLGNLPLRDWDEATVAQVAKEIWLGAKGEESWVFPTLWGEPYFNKPPLVHVLIAFFYSFGGVNEWTARLPGALLSSMSVPLLYGVGREIFVVRTPALFSALVYLTLLPVVRHGRLAMLDGAVVCFSILTIWCILRSRRDWRWSLAAGMSWGALCLTKGIMGLLIGAIALLFLWWDTPRLLSCGNFWIGSVLGSMPAIAWYIAQWLRYRQSFISTGLVGQSLERVYVSLDGHSGPIWYYLWEILKYSLPWLLFCLWGIALAWRNRNWGWAKLVLVWAIVYFAVVSLIKTKLPWYIMPIYPALSLASGVQLAEVFNFPKQFSYPRAWMIILGLLAAVASIGSIYFAGIENKDYSIALVLAAVGLTMGLAAILVARSDRQFIPLLFWGMYVSLMLFVSSPHWNWELNEAYPVKLVAAMVKSNTPGDRLVYTSFDYERPSLNFYSDRRVIPVTNEQILESWQKFPSPYLLLDLNTSKQLNLNSVKTVGSVPNWVLVTKNSND